MPETSQDAFETLFPGRQPVSAQQLRDRSNSLSDKQRAKITLDNSLIAAESNFWPRSNDRNKMNAGRGVRETRVSVGDVDSCYTAPEPYGYKREISHR